MTNATPPGWYPDASGSGAQRWWDGTQWSEHVQSPYQEVAAIPKAPAGTSPSTPQIWAIVGIFLLQLAAGLVYSLTVDWNGYMSSVVQSAGGTTPDPFAMYGYIFTPTYVVVLLLSFLGYGATILLAYFDNKVLRSRGIERPFHWALAFIPSTYGTIVYVIGRSVIAKRRTGSGLAPMWVIITTYVLALILSFVLVFAMMSTMMNQLSGVDLYR